MHAPAKVFCLEDSTVKCGIQGVKFHTYTLQRLRVVYSRVLVDIIVLEMRDKGEIIWVAER